MRSVTAFAHATASTSSAATIDASRTGRDNSPRNVSSTGLTAALQSSPLSSLATRVASSRTRATFVPLRMRPTSR